jgi:hypothetical protein
MKKRFEKILSDLISDYEVTRTSAESLEDPTSQDVAMQALANNLVLIQTQLNNMNLWNQYVLGQEELVTKKLVNKDIRAHGIDRVNTPGIEVD